MSDHLRRAYLAGDDPKLHGNLATYTPAVVFNATFRPTSNPTNRNNHAYFPPRDASKFYNRPLRLDGRLNLKPTEWSGTPYMLAPCPRATDPVDIKSMVLEHAFERKRNGTGKWQNKIDLLVNHFNQPLILTSTELETKPFYEFNSPLPLPIRLHEHL
jgi:hypothetical protein